MFDGVDELCAHWKSMQLVSGMDKKLLKFHENCLISTTLCVVAILGALFDKEEFPMFISVSVLAVVISCVVNFWVARRRGGADFNDSESALALKVVAVLPPFLAITCVIVIFAWSEKSTMVAWVLPYCAGQAGYFLHRVVAARF